MRNVIVDIELFRYALRLRLCRMLVFVANHDTN